MTFALVLLILVALLTIALFVLKGRTDIANYLVPVLIVLVFTAIIASALWTSALGASLPLLIAFLVICALGLFSFVVMR